MSFPEGQFMQGSTSFLHFTVDGDDCAGYVSVTWFGAPEYPVDGSPLVVRCREQDPHSLVDAYGCVVKITQIDPCQVCVERDRNTGIVG